MTTKNRSWPFQEMRRNAENSGTGVQPLDRILVSPDYFKGLSPAGGSEGANSDVPPAITRRQLPMMEGRDARRSRESGMALAMILSRKFLRPLLLKAFFPAVTLLFVNTAYADGPTAIHGVNNDGEAVIAHVEEYYGNVPVRTPLYPLYEQWSIQVEAADKSAREFKSQHCRYSGPAYQRGWSFSCAKIGASPLAGATYMFQKDLKNCGGSLFVCTSGCSPRAPRQMVKDYWECHEETPVCPSRPKIGKLSGDSVNLRDKPGAAGKILRTIAIGTRIEVLARNEQCLDIDNKTGQWIKVRLADDQPVREGWIFDGYVDYSGSGNQ